MGDSTDSFVRPAYGRECCGPLAVILHLNAGSNVDGPR